MQYYKWLIAVASAGLLGASGILAACGSGRNASLEPLGDTMDDIIIVPDTDTIELTAFADTEEEAQRIAELYQIELQSFSEGVAAYTTDKDPNVLIAMGQEQGYPLLYENNIKQLY